jgi:hypothetical protein
MEKEVSELWNKNSIIQKTEKLNPNPNNENPPQKHNKNGLPSSMSARKS